MTDEKLESITSNLSRAGVITSAMIVLLGGIVFLIKHHAETVTYATFHLERSNLRTLTGIIRSAMRLRPDAIMQLGLVRFIATPIVRVAFATLGFYLERDRLYVVVSLIVLAILTFSIMRAM